MLTAADVPATRFGPFVHDQEIITRDKVRFAGEIVAAIAATSLEAASRAAELVRLEIDPLSPIYDVETSMAPGSAPIHEKLQDYESAPEGLIRHGNVGFFTRLGRGDVNQGFAEADVVLERRYTAQAIHQCSFRNPRGTRGNRHQRTGDRVDERARALQSAFDSGRYLGPASNEDSCGRSSARRRFWRQGGAPRRAASSSARSSDASPSETGVRAPKSSRADSRGHPALWT